MKKELIYLKILQITVDAILVLGSITLAYFLQVGFLFSTVFSFKKYFFIALLTFPFSIAFMFFIRAYKLSQQINTFRHFQRLAFVALESTFMFMILYYFVFKDFFSRWILVFIPLLILTTTFVWHLLFKWILRKAFSKEIGIYRTLVIGTNRPAEALVSMLLTEKSYFKPVAIINAHGGSKKDLFGVPVVGKMNVFEKVIDEKKIDIILQVDHLEQSLNIINYALSHNIKYLMPPELLGIFQGHQMIEEIEGTPFLKVQKQKQWWHSIW